MVLGYEQPVDIPVQSIYNTDMMKTYLGALQRDYEQGVKEFNDFRDKYGDFISPIDGASEEYYNTGVFCPQGKKRTQSASDFCEK